MKAYPGPVASTWKSYVLREGGWWWWIMRRGSGGEIALWVRFIKYQQCPAECRQGINQACRRMVKKRSERELTPPYIKVTAYY